METNRGSPTSNPGNRDGAGAYPSHKRARHSPPEPGAAGDELDAVDAAAATLQGIAKVNSNASSFRNVSACNRCRLRKNRCDQRLPSCASCEKANVKCVGYDPITKREIPRRWV
jgi:hypothetical protein